MAKYNHAFDTEHLKKGLKKRSLQSGAITLISQVVQFVAQIGSTMILARILSPADYGINAMAVVVTGFAGIFSSLGLSTATIQKKQITHEEVSNLFWINTVVGFSLSLIVAIISPLVAGFYQKPELTMVLLTLSLMFAIGGLTVQHTALLNRQMHFFRIALINVFSMIIGISVAIVMGVYGFGYWALVFNSIVNVTCIAIFTWVACGWVPGLYRKSVSVKPMIKFGADLVGFNIIHFFSRNFDKLLLGKLHGAYDLGLYSKSYQLLMMPITNLRDPVVRVAMPALSSLQDDPRQYKNYYLKCISLLAFVSMPLVSYLYAMSDQIILLVLGEQWIASSELFKILALASILQPVVGTNGMVMISTGRSRAYMYLGAFNSISMCMSFIIGAPWGAKGMCISYAVANYIVAIPILIVTFRGTSIRVVDFLSSLKIPVFSSFVSAYIVVISKHYYCSTRIIIDILFSFIVFCLVYFLLIISSSRGRLLLNEYIKYTMILIGKK